jgi:hypothetical protein
MLPFPYANFVNYAENEFSGGVFFNALRFQKQRRTAGKQRTFPLFFRSRNRRRPRISAESETSLAVNFWKNSENSRQRQPQRGIAMSLGK